MALSVVLLIAAGLLVQSFVRLQNVPLGFNPKSLLTFSVMLPRSDYPDPNNAIDFFERLLERTRGIPGVQSAGLSNMIPFQGDNTGMAITTEGPSTLTPGEIFQVDWRIASPDYFRTMDIPLFEGRFFTEQDRRGAPNRMMISAGLARRLWPEGEPIGKRIRSPGSDLFYEVIGVVGDTKKQTLDQTPRPAVYFSSHAFMWPDMMTVVLRTAVDPLAMVSAIRQEVMALDSALPIFNVRTMEELLTNASARPRFSTWLLSLFAGVALTLAMVGIYGTIAYTVTQRAHEFGIRMALGAQHRDVICMVMRRGLKLIVFGLLFGLIGAFVLTRVLNNLLYEVTATDVPTYICLSLALTAVALLACYLPARRVVKIDPMEALRYE